MTDNDIISYNEYQKLSDEEKQNYEPHFIDGKSGVAKRKGTKPVKVKSIIPVNELKQADPSTARTTDAEAKEKETTDNQNRSLKVKANRMRNYLKDKADQLSGSSTDKTNQMSGSSTDKTNQMSGSSTDKTNKTDTTATDKSINPFQKEKETADKDVEDASILLDRAKQLKAKIDEYDSFVGDGSLFPTPINPKNDKELLELAKETEVLAKEFVIDTDSLSEEMKGVSSTMSRIDLLKKTNEEIIKAAEGRITAAKTKQANYTKAEEEEAAKRKAEEEEAKRKAEEEAAKRKAESKPAPKAQKAETETEKDKTEDPLEKAKELEQPESQAPDDIKRFSNDLNKFVIQAYLNGDFGKRSSPNAIATMGFFILDKLGTALVNASQVARGNSPSAKSQWSKILDKQTELLGNRISTEWFLSLPKEKQIALYRMGYAPGASSQTVYENIDPNAIDRAKQRDILGTSKLSQEQKGVAQSNVNALLARKSELQTLIAQLRSDQGWDVYTQAMNAIVGTAKGLNTLGVTDSSNSSSNKGFQDTLSADVKTGKITEAFVSGGISNNSSWSNSSAEALSKSNSLNQDALAYSKFKSGEEYAKASREAKKAANEQLIERLEGQIEIIDKCIDSWGKDLDL